MAAPRKNRNAAVEDPRCSRLYVRCTPAEKQAWERSAWHTPSLSDWITTTLNAASVSIPMPSPTPCPKCWTLKAGEVHPDTGKCDTCGHNARKPVI